MAWRRQPKKYVGWFFNKVHVAAKGGVLVVEHALRGVALGRDSLAVLVSTGVLTPKGLLLATDQKTQSHRNRKTRHTLYEWQQ